MRLAASEFERFLTTTLEEPETRVPLLSPDGSGHLGLLGFGRSINPKLRVETEATYLASLAALLALNLQPAQLELKGRHPDLGLVTVRQLLATWTAHDLGHLLQVSRVMAKRYKQEVGPWAQYLSVMG